jgi:dsRNA-specific ribonuclease
VSTENNNRRARLLREAWVGDAVLTLWARRWILASTGAIDGERSVRMTSNQFLSAVGNPDEVEAEIGRIYEAQGMEAATAWIEGKLLPMFRRQEENRSRRRP